MKLRDSLKQPKIISKFKKLLKLRLLRVLKTNFKFVPVYHYFIKLNFIVQILNDCSLQLNYYFCILAEN